MPFDSYSVDDILRNTLKELEKNFLRDRKFLAGEEISLADIQIIFFFGGLELANYELDNFAKLKEWKERVLASGIKADYQQYIEDSKVFRERLAKQNNEDKK